MANIIIQAGYIPNWTLVKTAGANVDIKFELTVDGIDSDNVPRLAKSGPTITCTVYKWDAVDLRFEDGAGAPLPSLMPTPTVADGPYLLYIPSISDVQSTTDWIRPACCPAYNLKFVLPNGSKTKWVDYTNTSIPAIPTTTSWMEISLYNKSAGPPMRPPYTYSRDEINALLTGFSISGAQIIAALGFTPENAANKSAVSGYAALDSTTKVPTAQLGSGSATGTTVLAGDRTWKTVATILGFTPADAAALANYSLIGHTHTASNITDFAAAVDARITNGAVIAAIGYTPQAVLGFTPENVANKNASNGYAGLSSGKITNSQVAEVLAFNDLSNVNTSGLTTGDIFAYDGTNVVPRGGTSRPLAVGFFDIHTPTSDLGYSMDYATTDPTDLWYWAWAIPGPGKVAAGFRGDYNASVHDDGSDFHLVVTVHNTGKRRVVAFASDAVMTAGQTLSSDQATVWGANILAFTKFDGSAYGGAIGLEINYGALGASANQGTTGLLVYAIPRPGMTTPAGVNTAAIQIKTNGTDVNAAPMNGIVFNVGMAPPVNTTTGALLMAQGVSAGYVINAAGGAFLYGIDFSTSTFSQAAIRLPNNQTGISVADALNTSSFSALKMDSTDQLFIGDFKEVSTHGIEEIRFHVKGAANANRARITANGLASRQFSGWQTGGNTSFSNQHAQITQDTFSATDVAGEYVFTTSGTPPGAGERIVSVAFGHSYPNTNFVVHVSPQEGVPTNAGGIHARSRATGGFDIYTDGALAPSTQYKIGYWVIRSDSL